MRVVERSLQAPAPAESRWRLMAAGDLHDALAAVERFTGVLAASLGGLGVLLALAALAQVAVGLAPLKTMQLGLQRVRDGRQQRLEGRFPTELQPLIDEFNGVLDRNAEVVERARAQAGNLAHALKTPLAILGQAARKVEPSEFSALVDEQVQVAERQMHWHLARARAAATQHCAGAANGARTGARKPAAGDGQAARQPAPGPGSRRGCARPRVRGEEQDLQEMLGNLLDNACRSARGAVTVKARREGPWLRITVDDDGPGIAPEQRAAVLQRGVRLDESRDGSGLGLAIVVDLARLYGGDVTLARCRRWGPQRETVAACCG